MSEARDHLADRIRSCFGGHPGIVEKKMFGSVAFLLDGHMVVGPMKDGTMLARVGKEFYAEAVQLPGAGPMRFSGREMSGFVVVQPEVVEDDESLAEWISRGVAFVGTLPPK